MKVRLLYHLQRAFSAGIDIADKIDIFGLQPSDRVEIFWEQEFLLGYYLGYTSSDVRQMPTAKRLWMLERLKKEIDKAGTAHHAAHENSPDARMSKGQGRDVVPARLRRF